ncbi:MAG TPA: hypothetical protein VMS35_03395 [Nitrososphaeraceae archaeon]|nr:hypothetical protein [Nitrososphaeraceae archaeon]
MSWFNFYGKDIRKSNTFLYDLVHNKGKFIRVIDDITDQDLSEKEIQFIEQERESLQVPHIEAEYDIKNDVSEIIKIKPGRKYKTRLPIPAKLRKEILEQYEKTCRHCGHYGANQLHHINGDPSDNRKENLKLLCYDCHKIEDKKINGVIKK